MTFSEIILEKNINEFCRLICKMLIFEHLNFHVAKNSIIVRKLLDYTFLQEF